MSRRVLVGFIIVNVIVSLAVAVMVISYDNSRRPATEVKEGPTQIVILTATPIGGVAMQPGEYQGTIDALQLTGTALSQSEPAVVVITSTPGGPDEGIALPETTAVATIDPALLPPIPTDPPPGEAPATLEGDGCIRHIVQSGEVIITIAQQYGVLPGEILIANGMTEDDVTRLQIGDVLVIPVEGCDILTTPTPVPQPTNTPFELTRTSPTLTLPPTVVNAQVVIADVVEWGNVNSEAVDLRNQGDAISLQGWTLANERGNIFRFPEVRMQPGSRLMVFTRQGPNTPAALYWGRELPAWADGDTLTLTDSAGQVQGSFRIGDSAPTFAEATPE
ncbi:MAG: lamin tail domain-containing protein [Anaerolineae bacterium]|nr:lamin tail domain-containing protein [Anaerolineae bacterium]